MVCEEVSQSRGWRSAGLDAPVLDASVSFAKSTSSGVAEHVRLYVCKERDEFNKNAHLVVSGRSDASQCTVRVWMISSGIPVLSPAGFSRRNTLPVPEFTCVILLLSLGGKLLTN